MRAASDALPRDDREAVAGRSAMHDFGWSRARVDPALVIEAERAAHPLVMRAILATENPYGPALHLGAHARSVDGLEKAEGRVWIERLMDFASNSGFVYAHHWRQGDVVAWDNRVVMHRATPFASTAERRHMVRTTPPCPTVPH